jgi:hypothetical protein
LYYRDCIGDAVAICLILEDRKILLEILSQYNDQKLQLLIIVLWQNLQ